MCKVDYLQRLIAGALGAALLLAAGGSAPAEDAGPVRGPGSSPAQATSPANTSRNPG